VIGSFNILAKSEPVDGYREGSLLLVANSVDLELFGGVFAAHVIANRCLQ
jgi:hypothetical protein